MHGRRVPRDVPGHHVEESRERERAVVVARRVVDRVRLLAQVAAEGVERRGEILEGAPRRPLALERDRCLVVRDEGVERVVCDVWVDDLDRLAGVVPEYEHRVVQVERGRAGRVDVIAAPPLRLERVFVPGEGLGHGLVLMEDGFVEGGEEWVHDRSVMHRCIPMLGTKKT